MAITILLSDEELSQLAAEKDVHFVLPIAVELHPMMCGGTLSQLLPLGSSNLI